MKEKAYLLIYDISDTKRRAKMSKICEAFGRRVQKSAFEFYLSDSGFQRMKRQALQNIGAEDNLRIYTINSDSLVYDSMPEPIVVQEICIF